MDVETTASTRIPAPVILVVLATLLFGAFANRWLARRTRRRVNVGFVAGGLAVLIMMVWVGTAHHLDGRQPQRQGTAAESLKTVTTMAITAQQARADETLSLIRRGDEDVRKQSYYQRIDTMQQQLSDYLARETRSTRPTWPMPNNCCGAGAPPTTGSTPTSPSATTRPPRRSPWVPARTTPPRRSTSSTPR